MLTLCPRSVPIYRQGCLRFLLLSSQRREGSHRSFPSLMGCQLNRPSLKNNSENRTNWPAKPSSSSHATHLQLQWDISVYFSVHLYNSGLKALTDPQSFEQSNFWPPRSFSGFSQEQGLNLKHCHMVFLHLPICNSPAPKPSLLLHPICKESPRAKNWTLRFKKQSRFTKLLKHQFTHAVRSIPSSNFPPS